MKKSPGLIELTQAATRARNNAYCPYSKHAVGAALRTKEGKIFSGCNVENSSYGATICAERVAIQNAISSCGKIEIEEILVMTDSTPPWPPCGMCRQVLVEFGKNMQVHFANLKGEMHTTTLQELLPNAFTSEMVTG